jgi:hypothetical protein
VAVVLLVVVVRLVVSVRPVGRLQPFPNGPIYDAMVKGLLGDGRAVEVCG